METKQKRLLDKEANKEHYSKSDGNFMPLQQALKAHLYLDRIAWAREKVYDLNSKFHLDCGCKDGYLALTLTAEGVKCVAFDPSKDAIEEASLKAQEARLEVHYGVSTIEEFSSNFIFDSVSCLEVLEHVVDVDLAIQKLASFGRFVMISTPDYYGRHGINDSERNEEHVRIFKQEELEELCSKYGNVVESVVRDDQICILFKSNKHED